MNEKQLYSGHIVLPAECKQLWISDLNKRISGTCSKQCLVQSIIAEEQKLCYQGEFWNRTFILVNALDFGFRYGTVNLLLCKYVIFISIEISRNVVSLLPPFSLFYICLLLCDLAFRRADILTITSVQGGTTGGHYESRVRDVFQGNWLYIVSIHFKLIFGQESREETGIKW